MTQKQWIWGGAVVVIILIAVAGWHYRATHTSVAEFAISPDDHISSWTFKGPYTGNDTLTTNANADIAKLQGLMGKGQYDDYDLWIGIANDEDLLGNGQASYDAFNHAIAIHPNDKGLAYDDLGHLMVELKAYQTAKAAYAKAVAAEPGVMQYHTDRLTFLTEQFPNDNADISAAFADASTQFGDAAPILSIEAEWLTGLGKYQDAISAWQRVEFLTPGADHTAVNAEIARLKAKL